LTKKKDNNEVEYLLDVDRNLNNVGNLLEGRHSSGEDPFLECCQLHVGDNMTDGQDRLDTDTHLCPLHEWIQKDQSSTHGQASNRSDEKIHSERRQDQDLVALNKGFATLGFGGAFLSQDLGEMADPTAEFVKCDRWLAGFCEDEAVWGWVVGGEGIAKMDKHGVEKTAEVSVELFCSGWALKSPSKDIWESS